MSTAPDELISQCREAMRRGSLSFFLAARLLGHRSRDAILMLYAWCRHCDDVIDNGTAHLDQTERLALLEGLRRETQAAIAQRPGPELVPRAMAWLARTYELPGDYPQELLAGMQMDLEGRTYEDLGELRLYCYRVAGVVGVMFSHIVGLSDAAALRQAADLGIAMQLTNIARDVLEDAAMGRIYLPRAWLAEAGIPAEAATLSEHKAALVPVVARLLDAAEEHYRAGERGLRYLPLRAALAAAAARFIYGEIGQQVRARGATAWDRRVYVPLATKLRLLARGIFLVLRDGPARLARPHKRQPLASIWRYS